MQLSRHGVPCERKCVFEQDSHQLGAARISGLYSVIKERVVCAQKGILFRDVTDSAK
jgi:hypothetical protein